MFLVFGILFFAALLASQFFSTVGWAFPCALLLLAILSIHLIRLYRLPSANGNGVQS